MTLDWITLAFSLLLTGSLLFTFLYVSWYCHCHRLARLEFTVTTIFSVIAHCSTARRIALESEERDIELCTVAHPRRLRSVAEMSLATSAHLCNTSVLDQVQLVSSYRTPLIYHTLPLLTSSFACFRTIVHEPSISSAHLQYRIGFLHSKHFLQQVSSSFAFSGLSLTLASLFHLF